MYIKITQKFEDSLDGFKIYYNNNHDEYNDELASDLVVGVATYRSGIAQVGNGQAGTIDFMIRFRVPAEKDQINEVVKKLDKYSKDNAYKDFSISGFEHSASIVFQEIVTNNEVFTYNHEDYVEVDLSGTIYWNISLINSTEFVLLLSKTDSFPSSCFQGILSYTIDSKVEGIADSTNEKLELIPASYSTVLTITYFLCSTDTQHDIIQDMQFGIDSMKPSSKLYVKFSLNGRTKTFCAHITENHIIGKLGNYVQCQTIFSEAKV